MPFFLPDSTEVVGNRGLLGIVCLCRYFVDIAVIPRAFARGLSRILCSVTRNLGLSEVVMLHAFVEMSRRSEGVVFM